MAAESGDIKFGSGAWFKAWGERLLQGNIDMVSNWLAPRAVTTGPALVTPGSVAGKAIAWIPYVLIAAAGVVLILVLKKR